MTLIHKGVRPTYLTQLLDFKRKLYIEETPDGEYKIWTKKMLNSGCGKSTRNSNELMGCLYCANCNEWFSKDQWERV